MGIGTNARFFSLSAAAAAADEEEEDEAAPAPPAVGVDECECLRFFWCGRSADGTWGFAGTCGRGCLWWCECEWLPAAASSDGRLRLLVLLLLLLEEEAAAAGGPRPTGSYSGRPLKPLLDGG